MVLFPVPASPFNQYTAGLSKSRVQSLISSKTVLRVPLRQPLRSPCRYSASCAQRTLLRTVASAVSGSRQVSITENIRCSNLGPAKRGYFICADAKGEHSLSLVDRGPPFFVLSVIHVSVKKGSMVINKPHSRRWSLADLRGVWKPLHLLEYVQQIAGVVASQMRTAVLLQCS